MPISAACWSSRTALSYIKRKVKQQWENEYKLNCLEHQISNPHRVNYFRAFIKQPTKRFKRVFTNLTEQRHISLQGHSQTGYHYTRSSPRLDWKPVRNAANVVWTNPSTTSSSNARDLISSVDRCWGKSAIAGLTSTASSTLRPKPFFLASQEFWRKNFHTMKLTKTSKQNCGRSSADLYALPTDSPPSSHRKGWRKRTNT